jgi:heme/copper-type cytochrome/quinol oxidase subunit 1
MPLEAPHKIVSAAARRDLRRRIALAALPGALCVAISAPLTALSFAPIAVLMGLPWPGSSGLPIDTVLHDSYYIVSHVDAVRPVLISLLLAGLAWLVLGVRRALRGADDATPIWFGAAAHLFGAFVLVAPPGLFMTPMPERTEDAVAAFERLSNWVTATNYMGLVLVGGGLIWLGYMAREQSSQ